MPIYDQTFRHYEGRRSERMLWWPIAWRTLRPILKAKFTWLLISGVACLIIVISVGFFASAKVGTMDTKTVDAAAQAAQMGNIPLFGRNITLNTVIFQLLDFQFGILWLLMLSAGGGIISSDLRFNALPLYFSRPLTVHDYIIGKVAGLSLLPFGVLGLATIIIFAQAIAYFYPTPELFLPQLPLMGATLLYVCLMCGFAALAMTSFSSMTKNARTAGIAYLGFWFLTGAIANIGRHAARIDMFAFIAPRRCLQLLAYKLLHPERRWLEHEFELGPYSVLIAAAVLAAYALIFIWIIRRNLKVIEVVK